MSLKSVFITITALFIIPFTLSSQKIVKQDLLHYASDHPPIGEVSLKDIADVLLLEAKNETDRAWIAFYWIAHHIDYETADNKDKGTALDLNRVIQDKKADVQTFSQLYRELCLLMGLECHIIPGYVRLQAGRTVEYHDYTGRPYKTLPDRPAHTWNAVKI